MKILISPDKFKGTMTAAEAAGAIRKGIANATLHWPMAVEIMIIPMADGGDGSLDIIISGKGRYNEVDAADALGRPHPAAYGIFPEQARAIIEAARVIGLSQLKKHERNPLETSSYGLGLVIKHAVSNGIREIILALGGSATSDCGAGMLAALGCIFTNNNGGLIPVPSGKDLMNIASINFDALAEITADRRFTVLADVDNPLLGTKGAAHVFAPQKGADAQMVNWLESGASHFYDVASSATATQLKDLPGAGAAGGIAWALAAFCGADITPGASYIGDLLNFEERISVADMVITGEGRFDSQSSGNKVVGYISELAHKYGKPLVICCGTYSEDAEIPTRVEIISMSEFAGEENSLNDPTNTLKEAVTVYFKQNFRK